MSTFFPTSFIIPSSISCPVYVPLICPLSILLSVTYFFFLRSDSFNPFLSPHPPLTLSPFPHPESTHYFSAALVVFTVLARSQTIFFLLCFPWLLISSPLSLSFYPFLLPFVTSLPWFFVLFFLLMFSAALFLFSYFHLSACRSFPLLCIYHLSFFSSFRPFPSSAFPLSHAPFLSSTPPLRYTLYLFFWSIYLFFFFYYFLTFPCIPSLIYPFPPPLWRPVPLYPHFYSSLHNSLLLFIYSSSVPSPAFLDFYAFSSCTFFLPFLLVSYLVFFPALLLPFLRFLFFPFQFTLSTPYLHIFFLVSFPPSSLPLFFSPSFSPLLSRFLPNYAPPSKVQKVL